MLKKLSIICTIFALICAFNCTSYATTNPIFPQRENSQTGVFLLIMALVIISGVIIMIGGNKPKH